MIEKTEIHQRHDSDHSLLWAPANRVVSIANQIREQYEKKESIPQDVLSNFVEALDATLAAENEIRSGSESQDSNQSSLTKFTQLVRTRAFSLTAKRRQVERTQPDPFFTLQRQVFKLKRQVEQMDPASETAQHQLLMMIDSLGSHPLLERVFSWRKNKKITEQNLADSFESSGEERINHEIKSILDKIKQDKLHADLTDSFSEDNPQFNNVMYVYNHIDQLSPESNSTIKAIIIIANALEFEEQQNKDYVSPFGNGYSSSHFWALSRHLLK